MLHGTASLAFGATLLPFLFETPHIRQGCVIFSPPHLQNRNRYPPAALLRAIFCPRLADAQTAVCAQVFLEKSSAAHNGIGDQNNLHVSECVKRFLRSRFFVWRSFARSLAIFTRANGLSASDADDASV